MFVIDVTESMHEMQRDAQQSCFQAAIRAATNMMMNRIISNETDLIGVVFYGTVGCFSLRMNLRNKHRILPAFPTLM